MYAILSSNGIGVFTNIGIKAVNGGTYWKGKSKTYSNQHNKYCLIIDIESLEIINMWILQLNRA